MTMTIEKKLRDFHFWSGAATNAAKLTLEELDKLEEKIETWRKDDGAEPYTTTEINDMFWFNFENILEWIGLDYEEVMARKDRWEA